MKEIRDLFLRYGKMSDHKIKNFAERALAICKERGWSRDWKSAMYLHLEASEFIEALRGKGDESPVSEAADVLFVLLSVCLANGITMEQLVKELDSPKYQPKLE